MPARRDSIELARSVTVPASHQVRLRLADYIDRTGLSEREMAERIGYGYSSLRFFLRGTYGKVGHKDAYIRAAAWDFLERHPIIPPEPASGSGPLFVTANYRRIRDYFLRAVDRGEICLLYGPPGTQKTFVLGHLIAERNREKKFDALYVYASHDLRPLFLLRKIGRAAGVTIGWGSRDRILDNLLWNFRQRPRAPAVVVDEAQHLPVSSLEFLRELYDRSGCGLVLAGSHDLFQNFVRGRQHLEQWLSRIDHKEPLPGLLEDEVKEVVERELSNGQPAHLTDRQIRHFVEACRVDDVFARDATGKPAPRKYLSARRLVRVLAQYRQQTEAA